MQILFLGAAFYGACGVQLVWKKRGGKWRKKKINILVKVLDKRKLRFDIVKNEFFKILEWGKNENVEITYIRNV